MRPAGGGDYAERWSGSFYSGEDPAGLGPGVLVASIPTRSSGDVAGIKERWGSMDLEVSVMAGWCEGDPEGDFVEWRRETGGMGQTS